MRGGEGTLLRRKGQSPILGLHASPMGDRRFFLEMGVPSGTKNRREPWVIEWVALTLVTHDIPKG